MPQRLQAILASLNDPTRTYPPSPRSAELPVVNVFDTSVHHSWAVVIAHFCALSSTSFEGAAFNPHSIVHP